MRPLLFLRVRFAARGLSQCPSFAERAIFAPSYGAKLADLIARLRAGLGAPAVPFIAGQLGEFAASPWDEFKRQVDQALRDLPEKVPHTAFVSAEGLQHRGDKLHFDADSYREFGKRYAAAYLKLMVGPSRPPTTQSPP